ncbi:glycosyltransferase family 4 protein [Streptomyces sp. MspMP-M5]|uniref:glycosyltransferase family 4 protein n=1 Tax=unclassified Streptomyces TaxID=2593676 RepID=UPI000376ADDD|nr:glycosyltransferase family 4 protein [Streptomyces sp. MspMP-M5]MYT32917.1 glycosyltransferase [Streptomyces sp. SID8354]
MRLTMTSPEYDDEWLHDTLLELQPANPQILPVDNGSGGQFRFGGLPHFRRLTLDTAHALNHHVLPAAEPSLVIAFDAPFFGLAPLLRQDQRRHLLLVPRSTARLHRPEDRERIAWERHGLYSAAASGARIAAISQHMRTHLIEDIGLAPEAVMDLPDGLGPRDQIFDITRLTLLSPSAARDGFVLCYGRARPYKGFDDLIHALAHLRDQGIRLPHTVIGAVTEAPEPSAYQRHLAHQIAELRLNATLVTRFTPRLRDLLAHPRLRAVVVPSRAEPLGWIPLEAAAAGAAPVVATDAGGLAESVIDGVTGYSAKAGDPNSLAAAIHRALTADAQSTAQLRQSARQLLGGRHDLATTIRQTLETLAPWALRSDGDRDRAQDQAT